MMGNQEAAALLIQNIGMFEQATLLLGEIEEKVDTAVNEKIETWVGNSAAEWLFDLDANGAVSFTHKFCEKDDTSWNSHFGLSPQGDEEDCHWLTSYCGKGKSRYGICFVIKPLINASKKWRSYLQQENQKHPKLQEIGFEFQSTDSGWWFLPFQLDAEKLAAAYGGCKKFCVNGHLAGESA